MSAASSLFVVLPKRVWLLGENRGAYWHAALSVRSLADSALEQVNKTISLYIDFIFTLNLIRNNVYIYVCIC